jgi:hypothetical protein
MTATMADMVTRKNKGGVQAPEEDLAFARQLVDKAKTDEVSLVGPGGLLSGLTKQVRETALEADMDEHLGYAHGDVKPGDATSSSR